MIALTVLQRGYRELSYCLRGRSVANLSLSHHPCVRPLLVKDPAQQRDDSYLSLVRIVPRAFKTSLPRTADCQLSRGFMDQDLYLKREPNKDTRRDESRNKRSNRHKTQTLERCNLDRCLTTTPPPCSQTNKPWLNCTRRLPPVRTTLGTRLGPRLAVRYRRPTRLNLAPAITRP